jgi:hypothetical protein
VTPTIDYTRDGLRHRKWVFPGFVCGKKGCCEGKVVDPDAWHGIGCEEWFYCVGDDPYAVSMTISTGRYLPEANQDDRPPEAWDMSSHHKVAEGGLPDCLCLSGARCYSDGTGLGASKWYAAQRGGVTDDVVFDYLRTELYPSWATVWEDA